MISDKGCVPHDLIPKKSFLNSLYKSKEFKNFLNKILNIKKFILTKINFLLLIIIIMKKHNN